MNYEYLINATTGRTYIPIYVPTNYIIKVRVFNTLLSQFNTNGLSTDLLILLSMMTITKIIR